MQAHGIRRMESFMQKLTRELCISLYGGAPAGRRHLALRLLHNILLTYAGDEWIAKPVAKGRWDRRGALEMNMPRREVRGFKSMDPDRKLQKARAAASPLGKFQPLCSLVHSPEFVEVCSSQRHSPEGLLCKDGDCSLATTGLG
jgi:hypothetical protein